MLAPDHRCATERDGASHHGAEVLRILDTVERDPEQRGLAEQTSDGGELELRCEGDGALMHPALAHAIEDGPAHALDLQSLIGCVPRQGFEARLIPTLHDHSRERRAMAPHGLAHGLQTDDQPASARVRWLLVRHGALRNLRRRWGGQGRSSSYAMKPQN